MKITSFIEKYFWAFLLAGLLVGVIQPVVIKAGEYLPEILLGMMLFFVFLKIDALAILENIKDYKLMLYISVLYMLVVPVLFFFVTNFFDYQIAIGILLLTAMPAGVTSPALTDIMKGNVSLAMSIALVTQVVAPFTVPLVFWIIGTKGLEINKLLMFKDMAMIVFLPMLLSQLVKKLFPESVRRSQHLFTSANIILLFAFVYIAISSQREIIIDHPLSLIWKTAIMYFVFIILHIIGYMVRYKDSKENRIALSVTSAYMNNGLAIVLASTYFGPEILVMMVLSEIPWNTLLAPFRRIIRHL